MTDFPQANITELAKYSSEFSSFGNDYLFSRITKSRPFEALASGPVRLNEITLLLVVDGAVSIDANLSVFKLGPNMLMTIGADCLIRIREVDWEKLDAYIFVISMDFMRDINLDPNIMHSVRYKPNPTSVMELTTDESRLMKRYFDLVHLNTSHNDDPMYVRSISRNLIAAAVYQLMQFVRKRSVAEVAPERQHSRRSTYVKDFLELVHKHHRSERSVAFYADKLFISPKYLSLIIKESTGRSAAQWIDEFVILEAKNMLRFSGKNVQQIAYELNFNNQSSFGKYFKHITGMSPTAYQRS